MSTFALEEFDILHSKHKMFKLLNDGKCEYDFFRRWAEGIAAYQSELETVDAVILQLARDQDVLPSRFKPLKRDKKDSIPDFEIKTSHLRIYLFKGPDGKIIVMGGVKKEQKEDIARMRKIKKHFWEQVEEERHKSKKKPNTKRK